jgi:hypothetical protein
MLVGKDDNDVFLISHRAFLFSVDFSIHLLWNIEKNKSTLKYKIFHS